ncbi:cleavage factor two protein 2 [[Candida] anglica]|uniref:Cleavage and polyadenylation specificity factor subunit 2 n=1 Tax=[Candida] anglica TaxID=148631 RepID=A0ABP0EDH2_9ASCO
MFTFSILENDSGSCRVSKLSFDADITILADPTWDGRNYEDMDFMEQHLTNVDIILLSHGTPEFIGGYVLLCIRFPALMAAIKVYSTVPVNQLGRISTVEFYRSRGIMGPIQGAILEVSEVDEWFDKVISLKYLQSISLFDNKLVMTPYNAGHTLGGTFWLLTKKLEKIIYAPAWNHSKDSFLNSASFLSLNGTPLSQLVRPTALITNTDLGSSMSHKKRTEKFLQLVDATLANGGSVVLPTSLSGRFLELLHLVDQHLQSAPIPVLFLSYSGTKVLSYASNLLEWMSSSLIKEWEDSQSHGASNKNNIPFDPSKVDLLANPNELLQLSGPKIVFCTGLDLENGDMSSEVLQYLCNDEKTTIILTEKSHFGVDKYNINAQLYREWHELAKKKQGKEGPVEDGIAVPLERTLNLEDWQQEESLYGMELIKFQEQINLSRKQKLLEKVRDKKNKNLLNTDNFSDSSSDEGEDDEDDEDEDRDNEKMAVDQIENQNGGDNSNATLNGTTGKSNTASGNNTTTPGLPVTNNASVPVVDELAAHEAFITDHVKQTLEANKPLDLRITKKLKPRQAMFPYFSNSHKQKFDDYGEIIDIKVFQKNDDPTKSRLVVDGKKGDDRGRGDGNWNEGGDWKKGKGGKKFGEGQANRATPQETLNNQVLQKNLDTLFNPQKRVRSNKTTLRVRCGLSFVDLSGLVDLRSLSLIVSLIKPYNIVLLPDYSSREDEEDLNSLKTVKGMFDQQQEDKQEQQFKKDIANSARYMSLATIRGGLSGLSGGSNNQMQVSVAERNHTIRIGYDDNGVTGMGLTNFEIKLDDAILENLKWQKIDGSYKVAQVYGELEITNQQPEAKRTKRAINDYMNSSTQFTLKHLSKKQYLEQQQKVARTDAAATDLGNPTGAISTGTSNLGPKLAIGNIRLTELKKKLLARNLNVEFKSEGTLVVNECLAIRKVTYGSSEGDDTGDIVIDGSMGALYYDVKDCIREMLAYV